MAEENTLSSKMENTDLINALSDNAVREADEEKYLIFRSDGILYGVEADYVNEILTEVSVTRVPMTPEYVRGVINLRGLIPPIIDFRLLLGRMPGDNYCAIILNIEGATIGILADGVDQMVDIPRSIVLPVPTQRDQNLVSGMCTVPGSTHTVMLMDASALIHMQ